MKVFISWSKERSKYIAECLRDWLPQVIQVLQPWISSSDIDQGVRWDDEIATELKDTKFGIICLTPENLNEPWINFEAGAISKTVEKAYVCPYVHGMPFSSVTGPLSRFQLSAVNREDTCKLVQTINRAAGDPLTEKALQNSFEKWWPDLEKRLALTPGPEEPQSQKRSTDEVLEELVELTRGIARQVGERPDKSKASRSSDAEQLRVSHMSSRLFKNMVLFGLSEAEKERLQAAGGSVDSCDAVPPALILGGADDRCEPPSGGGSPG